MPRPSSASSSVVSRARELAAKLHRAEAGPLKQVADRLRALSGTGHPLAVARLRGGTWRDDSWARLPSQPAIICSTVDQVGSALLFRSYGQSDRTASIWAGLAANDSLILLDEAHCAVPFLQTLRAVARFRDERWASAPIKTPFRFSVLSATPPADIPEETSFPRPAERAAALGHPVLQQRLAAQKLSTLLSVKGKGDADELIAAASERAGKFLGNGRQRVAVMVNRVATAEAIAARAREAFGDRAEVILLTGRIRPLDRDGLVAKWSRVLKAGSGEHPAKPIILVTTQCLEVGADFSFDALVTECASLDALRQRFGRLDRLGALQETRASILIREADAKGKEPDAIYGEALAKTWHWLSENATPGAVKDAKEIDFGVHALDALVNPLRASDEDRFTSLLAPTADAPILLPAHLDLLCQTAPRPVPEPDVSLFLHGKERGAPEVRVLWRADLPETVPSEPIRENEESWLETLSLLPPTSPEMLSVPLYRLRHWLTEDHAEKADDSDVEGLPEEWALEKGKMPRHHARSAFCLWRGRDRFGERRSLVTCDVRAIRPGDIVVLPAELGIIGLGQVTLDNPGLGPEQLDLAERALRQARGRVVLRLNRKLFGDLAQRSALAALLETGYSSQPERSEIEEGLQNLETAPAEPQSADSPPPPPIHWLAEHARLLAKDGFLTEQHPNGGLILTGKKVRPLRDGESEDDPLADDEDATSSSNESVTLRDHTAAVQATARDFATRCLGSDFAELYGAVGYSHDSGKLDPRFQLLLQNGDELAAASGPPLAKSACLPERLRRRWDLREDGSLPEGFRHEFLSAQLAQQAGLVPPEPHAQDLFLHLLGSHHGHARPFAPIVSDPVVAEGRSAAINLTSLQCAAALTGAQRAVLPAPHELRAGIADRFWRLNRRLGWWGLAYLEAVFRLADWHASRHPGVIPESGSSSLTVPLRQAALSVTCTLQNELPLDALDGANPLAYLAALGALRLLVRAFPAAQFRLSWTPRLGAWRPVLHTGLALTPEEVANSLHAHGLNLSGLFTPDLLTATVCASPKNKKGEASWQDKLQFPIPAFREFCLAAAGEPDCLRHEFAAAWAGETAPAGGHDDIPLARKTRFDFTAGQQAFIKMLRALREAITPEDVRRALFDAWRYLPASTSMRWDPQDEKRQYAVQAVDPTNGTENPPLADEGANFLAVEAMPLFPLVPDRWANQPCFDYSAAGHSFRWPLWRAPLSLDSIRSLLTLPVADAERWPSTRRHALGLVAVFVSRIVQPSGRYRCFTPAQAV